MIIWIASYPKSGNTWVRAFIAAYLYSKDGNFNFSDLNKIDQFPSKYHLSYFLKDLNDPAKTPKFWLPAQNKTHNAMCTIDGHRFTNKENTLASVYIVREPRNVITSLSNHYGLSLEDAYEFIINKRKIIFSENFSEEKKLLEERGNAHFIGSWEEHYKSWKNITFSPVKIIKYEDLINNTYNTFFSILKFLGNHIPIKIDKIKLQNTINACSFDVLKKKEEKEGFFEAPISKKNSKKIIFFNLGKKNNWKNNLNPTIEKKIRKQFATEMTELGYL